MYAELVEVLHARSLWDEVTAVLDRRGFELPSELLDRDFSVDHPVNAQVAAAWVRIYADPGPENHLRLLGEALTEVAERFGDWRRDHLKAVERTMGAKVGSGGSAGAVWLRRGMARVVFPELWSARTQM